MTANTCKIRPALPGQSSIHSRADLPAGRNPVATFAQVGTPMTATKKLLALAVFAAFTGTASAQPEKKDQAPEAKKLEVPLVAVPHSNVTMSLAECLAIGQNQQPTVRAAIASLKGAESGLGALSNVGIAAKALSPDLEIRKKQGERGLVVASADVEKALQENKYDIIRLYYSFVYARQQDQICDTIIIQLEQFYQVAESLSTLPTPPGGKKITRFELYSMQEAINEVKKLRITARIGQSQALAALKEAMGVCQDHDFIPRDTELPLMGGSVTQEQVVNFAQCRRPEMAMAAAGVDAFRLEICAQAAVKYRLKVPTLAFGSDLHSRLVPLPHRNGEYRPGALAPEMPVTLVGKKDDRVARATDISARQDALFDKTRDLVTLEAVNAYLHWQACTERLKYMKGRYEESINIAKEAREAASNKNDPELAIRYQALSGKSQAEFVEAVFEHLKALATLERVTSGGVKPAFPDK